MTTSKKENDSYQDDSSDDYWTIVRRTAEIVKSWPDWKKGSERSVRANNCDNGSSSSASSTGNKEK